jgi:hypothetical protein
LIKKHYPHLRYVRIHTTGKHSAVIYAWNDNLELSEQDRKQLKRFASGYLSPYVCYQVKEYPMVQNDRVPQTSELPEKVMEAAMDRCLDQQGITSLMNGMIAGGSIVFEKYDAETGTLRFHLHSEAAVTGIEQELIRQYLYEVVPIGYPFEVAYS